MIIRNTVSALLLIVIMGVTAQADTVALNPDYPARYVVVKGDTLWDISARFLRDPWKWPDVWQVNPQIENPNLIYPGDVISLVFHNGKPVLQVQRGPATESNVVKLEPHVRVSPLKRPIPTLPIDAIQQFLLKAQVISPEEKKKSGYIVSMEEERLIGGTGNKIYGRRIQRRAGGHFEVVRVGKVYRNPGASKNDILGYEALHIADARVEAYGDPSTLILTKASREALVGDRIVPAPKKAAIDYNFLPRAPEHQIQGKIIALFDAVSRVGQYQVVVLNQGSNGGLQPGNVLAVYHAGATIRDTVADEGEDVTLPDTRSGLLMVFKVFDKVSYGLIMTAQRDIRLYDMVRNP
ncbi:MAG: LysM peptidoglycan-binding domain-containing protein [Gammaproteobacteria bacterium]|jgi:hypothetical protein